MLAPEAELHPALQTCPAWAAPGNRRGPEETALPLTLNQKR